MQFQVKGKRKGRTNAVKAISVTPPDLGVLVPGTPAFAKIEVEMEDGTVRNPLTVTGLTCPDPLVTHTFVAPNQVKVDTAQGTEFTDTAFIVTGTAT